MLYLPVQRLVAAGQFAQAYAQLLSEGRHLESGSRAQYQLILGELEVELGDLKSARTRVSPLIDEDVTADLRSRAHRVLAKACFHLGETESSLNHLGIARALSLAAKDDLELAHVELSRFGLFSGVDSLASDAACLPELRKLIAKSGRPHL